MPELPEVETIKLGLQSRLPGLVIKKILSLSPKTFQGNPKLVEGKKVLNILRRGKLLGVELGAGPAGTQPHPTSSLVTTSLRALDGAPRSSLSLSESKTRSPAPAVLVLFHLKMTGQLIYDDGKRKIIGGHPTPDMRDEMPNKSTRVIFEFNNGSKLYFNDQRRFGWVKIVNRKSLIGNRLFDKLGPEPFDGDFTWQILRDNLLKHKNLPIKVVIMDQSTVAGVGNIYASEALFLAKIDPRRKVNSLSDKDFEEIFTGIKKALELGIKHGGSTRAHFVDAEGKKGYFLDYAYVYWRTGQRCKQCTGVIKKIQQGGRGTYFCPNCQR